MNIEAGFSWERVSYYVTTGRFSRVQRGIYRLVQFPGSPYEDLFVAWLRIGPEAVISHESALYLYGLSAGEFELQDWFCFEVEKSESQEAQEFGGNRFHIRALLDGRTFEDFHVEVGIGDLVIDPIEELKGPSLLDFADIEPTLVPCYPITQQIAEKVHAYTRPYVSGESSRVKDFVDILLLAELGPIDSTRLYRSIQATFEARKTHPLPHEIPDSPAEWSRAYQKQAAETSLNYRTLDEANNAIRAFLNPLFSEKGVRRWNPAYWTWS